MEHKNETVNRRVTPQLNDLLRMASARERRPLSSMVEFLALEHRERHQIAVQPRQASDHKTVR